MLFPAVVRSAGPEENKAHEKQNEANQDQRKERVLVPRNGLPSNIFSPMIKPLGQGMTTRGSQHPWNARAAANTALSGRYTHSKIANLELIEYKMTGALFQKRPGKYPRPSQNGTHSPRRSNAKVQSHRPQGPNAILRRGKSHGPHQRSQLLGPEKSRHRSRQIGVSRPVP